MKKLYIVKKVFEDENDNRNRYPVNSIISFDDEKRINNLVERGLIEELSLIEETPNVLPVKENENLIDTDDKSKKNKKKGDK